MSEAVWTTWWARAQRGMGLSPFQPQQIVSIPLPPCSKVRFRFAAYYEQQDVTIQDGVFLREDLVYPLRFQGSSTAYLSAGASICSDEIVLDRKQSMGELQFFIKADRMNSGTSLESYDEVSTSNQLLFALESIDIYSEHVKGCVIAFGDSITQQGHWTSVVSRYLEEKGYRLLNLGISGNRLLRGLEHITLKEEEAHALGLEQACELTEIPLGKQVFGIAGIQRFQRDVSSHSHIAMILCAIGINDLYQPGTFCAREDEMPSVKELQTGYEVICRQALHHQVPLLSLTITPFALCDHFTNQKEQLRSIWNQWLSSCRLHTSAIVFDHALMNTDHALHDQYHGGDHLHPNTMGGKVMAELIIKRLEEYL